MNIMAALKREEAKFEKAAEVARQQLETVREAMRILERGASFGPKTHGKGKRTMSAVVREKISKAAKARWAKIKTADKPKASESNIRPGKHSTGRVGRGARKEKTKT